MMEAREFVVPGRPHLYIYIFVTFKGFQRLLL